MTIDHAQIPKDEGVHIPADNIIFKVMCELKLLSLLQVVAILNLPHNNADCEHSFSTVQKVYTQLFSKPHC